MNELIPIQDNDGAQAVMGRDLHAFLEVTTAYKDWFPRMVAYGFEQDKDFSSILSESTGAAQSKTTSSPWIWLRKSA